MRNLVNTAVVAFEVLKSSNVGLAGSTGAVLNRTLTGLRELIARSIEEVRLTTAGKNRKQILVSDFIVEIGAAATLEADARGLKLTVAPVQEDCRLKSIDKSSRRWSGISCRTRSSSRGLTVP